MIDIRDGSCPLCRHNEILEINAETSGYGGHRSTFAAHHRETGGFFSSTEAEGAFLTYVCRKCGYAQWFAEAPSEITVGDPGVRLIQGAPPPGESYR